MPRRETEIEQRRDLDRLVQANRLELWLFAVGQFIQMSFAPGQQLTRRPFTFRQTGEVGVAVAKVYPGAPAVLLQARERDSVLANDDTETGLCVAQ